MDTLHTIPSNAVLRSPANKHNCSRVKWKTRIQPTKNHYKPLELEPDGWEAPMDGSSEGPLLQIHVFLGCHVGPLKKGSVFAVEHRFNEFPTRVSCETRGGWPHPHIGGFRSGRRPASERGLRSFRFLDVPFKSLPEWMVPHFVRYLH